jgi:hypothetical protein
LEYNYATLSSISSTVEGQKEYMVFNLVEFQRADEIQFPAEIAFPPFHLLIGKRKDSEVVSGVCLDFGNFAHSETADFERAVSEVRFSLVESCVSYIFTLQDRGLLNHLFYNKIHDQDLWNRFTELNDKRKVSLVQNWFQNRGKLLKEESGKKTWHLENDFPSLEKLDRTRLSHWLERLSQADPVEARLILHKMVASVFDPDNFKKQNMQKSA